MTSGRPPDRFLGDSAADAAKDLSPESRGARGMDGNPVLCLSWRSPQSLF
jgi:hypothetical protein